VADSSPPHEITLDDVHDNSTARTLEIEDEDESGERLKAKGLIRIWITPLSWPTSSQLVCTTDWDVCDFHVELQ